MKSRFVRAGIIAAEATGIVIAVLFAATAFVGWRVQAGPVDVAPAIPAIKAVVNASSGELALVRKISKATVLKVDDEGGYRLELKDTTLRVAEGGARATLPLIELDFYPADFISGKVGARRIAIHGAELSIVRRSDRKLKIDLGSSDAPRGAFIRQLTGGPFFRGAFESAELTNLSIDFVDTNSGRHWTGSQGRAILHKRDGAYSAELASDFNIGGRKAALLMAAEYKFKTDTVTADLSLDAAPVGDLIAVFFNENADLFTSPVSGKARVVFSGDGAVKSSSVDIRAGAGALTLGGWSTPVEHFEARAAFDPAANKFEVERIAWKGEETSGAVVGDITLTPAADGRGIDAISFALAADPVMVGIRKYYDAPWTIDRAEFAGEYGFASRTLRLSALDAEFVGLALKGSAALVFAKGVSPGAAADIGVEGTITPQDLLRVWPKGIVFSARDFVETRLPKATLGDVAFTCNLQPGAVGEDGAIPDEAMTLRFTADNAQVYFDPGMTPLTGVSGAGVLKGNSFRFDAKTAKARNVRLTKGEVEIPVLAPKGEPGYYRFDAVGDAGEILSILDEQPLAVLAESNYTPAQFSGPVRATVEIMRPNLHVAPPESYEFKGVAFFEHLTVDDIVANATFKDGKGRLDLSTGGMTIKGDGAVGGAAISVVWKQRFFGTGDKTEIDFTGVADSSLADVFSVPTRQFVQGKAPFKARALGGVDRLRMMSVEADLTQAVLVSEPLGWMKPEGVAAAATGTIEFAGDGGKKGGFEIAGDGIAITGSLDLLPSGAVRSFAIPTLKLGGAADLSLSGARGEGDVVSMTIEGAYLNAATMMRQLINEGPGEGAGKTAMTIDARLGRLELREGAIYENAALNFSRNENHIDLFEFKATGASGKPLTILLDPAAEADGMQTVVATAADVGEMLAGVFGLTTIRGGEGRLDFAFTPGKENAARVGALEAHDLRVTRTPVLAKIFAAASLTGLADLINGEGIELKNAMARFSIEGDAVRIMEARATGPSLGITAQGAFDLGGERAIALKGAVAPAYGVNSLLGKTPVIGDIFVNRKGEGLLALSYDVSGPASEPRVTVNPLSAFTPGVFRRMFEGRIEEEAPAQPEVEPDKTPPEGQ